MADASKISAKDGVLTLKQKYAALRAKKVRIAHAPFAAIEANFK